MWKFEEQGLKHTMSKMSAVENGKKPKLGVLKLSFYI